MNRKLVSVITPCYNSGKFIHRLLETILEQDYPCLEMYVIDDGSVDNTKEVIKNYITKFDKRGYTLTYIFQENEGQSVAVNRALKSIKGEYLVWPDSDDFYANSSAISKMVSILDKSDDSVSMVRCLPIYLNEETLALDHKTPNVVEIYNEYLFEDCLFGKKYFWFVPGDYMVKMSILDKCIRNREIYTEKNAGQNWQLMLPLLYQYRCITIGDYLYNVVIREESHSRGQYKTFERVCDKLQSYENTLICTLNNMLFLSLDEREKYIYAIRKKYLLERLNVCLKYHRKEDARIIRKRLEKDYQVTLSLTRKLDYLCCLIPGYFLVKQFLSSLKYKYLCCK